MSALTSKILLQFRLPTSLHFVRGIKRINIQRPRKPHYQRQRVIDVCTPRYLDPRKGMSLIDLCEKSIEMLPRETPDNPYERILAREALNWFNHSRMIAFFHANPQLSDDSFSAKIWLKRRNMHLRRYGRKVMNMALEGTNYEPVLQLFVTHNFIVFSAEPQLANLVKFDKKVPQLILVAAVLDGKLLSKNEIVHYSKIPNLQTAQAGLVSVLNMAAMQLRQNLLHHQQTLVAHLQKHIELQQKGPDDDKKE